MNFCDRLATERKRLGFRQPEFAGHCGVSGQTQSLYETGKRYPDAEYLMKACELGADPAFLLVGRTVAEMSFNMADEDRGALERFVGLSPKARQAMIALLDVAREG